MGCAGRKPVAASTPPPLQPTATPPAAEERAKRATSTEPITRPRSSVHREESSGNVAYIEEGNASWYGPTFHGRRSSSGEIYDMNKLTAAHRTMAFGTMVKVTNLSNGKSTVVRITDRGPFVENRIIDLSKAAAIAIESIGPGVVPVRLEVVSGGDPFGGFFTVQVGAFKEKDNADRLQARLNELYPPSTIQMATLDEGTFYRVRAGKIFGEQNAQKFAEELKTREGFHTLVIRLDDASPEDGQ
jgi:rare lipoprotein A